MTIWRVTFIRADDGEQGVRFGTEQAMWRHAEQLRERGHTVIELTGQCDAHPGALAITVSDRRGLPGGGVTLHCEGCTAKLAAGAAQWRREQDRRREAGIRAHAASLGR